MHYIQLNTLSGVWIQHFDPCSIQSVESMHYIQLNTLSGVWIQHFEPLMFNILNPYVDLITCQSGVWGPSTDTGTFDKSKSGFVTRDPTPQSDVETSI
jgi:hypothetical protein